MRATSPAPTRRRTNPPRRHSHTTRVAALASALVLGWGLALSGLGIDSAFAATGTITGDVFRDSNADGVHDDSEAGIAGIGITAYGADGAEVGSATTEADGSYTLEFDTGADGSTEVRLEFDTPSGLVPSRAGMSGSTSGSTIQFVSAGEEANVGFFAPGEVAGDNPTLIWAEQFAQVFNNVGGWIDPATQRSIGSLPYETRGYLNDDVTTEATMDQTGSVWGLARIGDNHVVTSALYKRHVITGPAGLGGIYLTELGGAPDAAPFVTIPNAGTDPRPDGADDGPDGYDWFFDVEAFDQVGKIGLGGLSVTPAGDAIYVVNLNDGQLYRVPVTMAGGAPVSGQPEAVADITALPGMTCAPENIRPFGVEVSGDSVFVTATCVGPDTADLAGWVFELGLDGSLVGDGPVLEIGLGDMPRGSAWSIGAPGPATWEPWSDEPGTVAGWATRPQPLLSDIAFDSNGDMTVAMKDRWADQLGYNAGHPDGTTPGLYSAGGAGDVLRACVQGGDFVLEDNGTCGGRPGSGVGNNEGPGGGEYYDADDFAPWHNQTALGAVLQVPGFDDIVTSNYDPGALDFSQGFRFVNNVDGSHDATNGFVQTARAGTNGSMGKGSGIGDLDVLLADPIEIGNRVWIDTNRDGIQDPGEEPVEGVSVELVCGDITAVTETNADGEYWFNDENVDGGLPRGTECTLTFTTDGTDAEGLDITTATAGSNAAIDSDGVANDDGNAVITLTTPVAGADHTYDVGYITEQLCSVGDFVWRDLNNDGVQDPDEPGVPDVTVTLIDPETGEPVPGIDPVTTGPDGEYEIVDIPCGDYQIEFSNIPPDTTWTTPNAGDDDTVDSDPIPDPEDPTTARTETFTVEPSDDPIDNPTIDAGIVELCTIGDYVWYDTNNNGSQDPGEEGVPGVTVTLLDADGNPVEGIDPQVTGDDGAYLFEGIPCGSYQVQFSDIPEGYGFTTPNAPGVDDGEDSDAVPTEDDLRIGVTATYELGADPTDPADNTDLTVDAGIVQACFLGDYVWLDVNRDGQQDPGEPGVPGVTVTLIDPETGEPVEGVDPVVTDSDGYYQFQVPCGEYIVEFSDIPDGHDFTTPTTGDPETDSDPTPTDDPGVGRTPPYQVGGDNPPNRDDIDAGLVGPTCGVGDYVWYDVNGNGIQDEGEDPVPGVTVTLLDADGEPIAGVEPTQTDADGWYQFDLLACGDYRIQFSDLPDGWTLTIQGAGDSATDSNPDPATGITDVFTLGDGAADNEPSTDDDAFEADVINPTIDAGLVQVKCTVSGIVWLDSDRDGVRDDSESPVPGVTVTLLDEDGNPVEGVDPAVTGSDGTYVFEVECGTYRVSFDDPKNRDFTPPGEGDDPGVDSDPDPKTGITGPVTVSPDNPSATGIDAGLLGSKIADTGANSGIAAAGILGLGALIAGASTLVARRRQ